MKEDGGKEGLGKSDNRWSKRWLTRCASPPTVHLCKQRGLWLCKKKEKKTLLASLATANSSILPDALGGCHSWQGAASTLVPYIYLFIIYFIFFAMASLQVLTSLGLK